MEEIWSEDCQDGRQYGAVRIPNPFSNSCCPWRRTPPSVMPQYLLQTMRTSAAFFVAQLTLAAAGAAESTAAPATATLAATANLTGTANATSTPAPSPATRLAPPAERAAVLAIFRELIELDTTHDHGSTGPAAEAVAKRLRAAGIPAADIHIVGPSPAKQNVVARLRGGGARPPLLLLGHLDVVEARRADWSFEPFHLTERDGYYYGRGTQDMKALDACWIAHLIRLRREARPLDRDVILALTADEEIGDANGVEWLLANSPQLIQAAYALNEGAGGELKGGRRRTNDVQASEKGYFSFRLEVHNKGGHSSLPERDNAIVRLAHALVAVHDHTFDPRLTPVTRAMFERLAPFETGAAAADLHTVAATTPGHAPDAAAATRLATLPFYNARLRTTCVPTRVQGGHADNALPQLATALVNCRLLPGDSPDDVRHALERAISDDGVSIVAIGKVDVGPDSPLLPELFQAVTAVTANLWPGVPVMPVMSTGATDGRFLRAAGIPTFGVSGVFSDVDDVRSHGRDERILVQSFLEGQEFTWELLLALASPAKK
jgi:acetylornithine deacetylase/succinyl-diaminopimelate desuccinylase-like protein